MSAPIIGACVVVDGEIVMSAAATGTQAWRERHCVLRAKVLGGVAHYITLGEVIDAGEPKDGAK